MVGTHLIKITHHTAHPPGSWKAGTPGNLDRSQDKGEGGVHNIYTVHLITYTSFLVPFPVQPGHTRPFFVFVVVEMKKSSAVYKPLVYP